MNGSTLISCEPYYPRDRRRCYFYPLSHWVTRRDATYELERVARILMPELSALLKLDDLDLLGVCVGARSQCIEMVVGHRTFDIVHPVELAPTHSWPDDEAWK